MPITFHNIGAKADTATCNGCINLPKALEAALFNGKDLITGKTIGPDTGDADSFDSFEALYSAYRVQCEAFADEVMHMTSSYESYYPVDVISPVLSSTYADSVEKGIDAFHGGAKYNNSSINAFGSATMADSLIAIKKLVFEEKKFTLAELKEALEHNFGKGAANAAEITEQVARRLAESGVAIVILSSEAQEIIRLCDRALVMYHGEIRGELDDTQLNEHTIMLLATGGTL